MQKIDVSLNQLTAEQRRAYQNNVDILKHPECYSRQQLRDAAIAVMAEMGAKASDLNLCYRVL